MKWMLGWIAAFALVGPSASADTQPLAWSVESIPWGPVAADGTRYALLEGSRDDAGAVFSYAFSIPAGVWDRPHSHAQDARVFVASGTLHLGYGDVADPDDLVAYPAGSFLVVPANVTHFDGSSEETVIIGVARGPWSTRYVDPEPHGSAGTSP